jgi:hypothetical protein
MVCYAVALESAPISAPPANPTTEPTGSAALPTEFQLFQTRSAFAADGHATAGPGAVAPVASGPDASFVLRGIAQIDDHFTAIFEDAGGKNAIQACVGDALAAGRVKSIDLDQVEYESAGHSQQIAVGQNLRGEVVAPIPTSQPAAPPGNGPNDNPGNGPDAASPDGQPPQPPHAKPRKAK